MVVPEYLSVSTASTNILSILMKSTPGLSPCLRFRCRPDMVSNGLTLRSRDTITRCHEPSDRDRGFGRYRAGRPDRMRRRNELAELRPRQRRRKGITLREVDPAVAQVLDLIEGLDPLG